MKRLTKRFAADVVYDGKHKANDDTGDIPCECSPEAVREILHRLADYEDAEAEGRLVVLPCKAGELWKDRRGDVACIDSVRWDGVNVRFHYEDGRKCACYIECFNRLFARMPASTNHKYKRELKGENTDA